MIVIPLEKDEKTLSSRFRKADVFVFIEKEKGIVFQENNFKTNKSNIFFENFKKYDVDRLYIKDLGYKTYLKLQKMNIEVYLIPDEVIEYTHIEPNDLTLLTTKNAKENCSLGHTKKENS